MTYVGEDIIRLMKKLLELKGEACGFILENDVAYIDAFGEYKEGERGSCQLSKYTEVIWHTHPYTSKAYPSVEDIFKVSTSVIRASLVFTMWGLWIIYNTRYGQQVDFKAIKRSEKARTFVTQVLDNLYYQGEHGISDAVRRLNKVEEIKVYFIPWNEVKPLKI